MTEENLSCHVASQHTSCYEKTVIRDLLVPVFDADEGRRSTAIWVEIIIVIENHRDRAETKPPPPRHHDGSSRSN